MHNTTPAKHSVGILFNIADSRTHSTHLCVSYYNRCSSAAVCSCSVEQYVKIWNRAESKKLGSSWGSIILLQLNKFLMQLQLSPQREHTIGNEKMKKSEKKNVSENSSETSEWLNEWIYYYVCICAMCNVERSNGSKCIFACNGAFGARYTHPLQLHEQKRVHGKTKKYAFMQQWTDVICC